MLLWEHVDITYLSGENGEIYRDEQIIDLIHRIISEESKKIFCTLPLVHAVRRCKLFEQVQRKVICNVRVKWTAGARRIYRHERLEPL